MSQAPITTDAAKTIAIIVNADEQSLFVYHCGPTALQGTYTARGVKEGEIRFQKKGFDGPYFRSGLWFDGTDWQFTDEAGTIIFHGVNNERGILDVEWQALDPESEPLPTIEVNVAEPKILNAILGDNDSAGEGYRSIKIPNASF